MNTIIVRVNGYTGPKIQAVKDIRGFAALQGNPWVGGSLKGAKELCDEVDQGRTPTFEITHMPGAKLGLLKRKLGGVDIEVISTSGTVQLELVGDDATLLLRALEAYAAVVGMIKSPEEGLARRLAETIEGQL